MRTIRTFAAGGAGLLLVIGGYAAADVYDKVPGVLTRADAPRDPVPVPGASAPAAKPVTRPGVPAAPAALGQGNAPVPDAAKLAAAIRPLLSSNQLGPTTSVTVRDGLTGQHLADIDADGAHTPASVTKLLSAYAIAQTLDLDATLDTKVVTGAEGEVVLVAGGDTALAPGKGDPDEVNGHAGLGDLAAQVATQLKAKGQTMVKVGYDLSYAPGPLQAASWDQINVDMGFTTRIAMIGLSTKRADPGTAPPKDPARTAADAFVKALGEQGISAELGGEAKAPQGAQQLGLVKSAPIVDVVGLALRDSDNAMIEALSRQGAAKDGKPGDTASVEAWVMDKLSKGGIDTGGVKLVDMSGLSDGTTIPARVLADVLVTGTSGKDKPYQDVLSRLPVSAWNGTLDDRYLGEQTKAAAGEVRAKTGSLPSASALAGTVRNKDGRLLVFAIVNNGTQPQGAVATRAAIDRIVTALATVSTSRG